MITFFKMSTQKKKRKSFSVKFILAAKACKNFFLNLLFPDNLKCTFCGYDIPDFDERPFCEDCAKELPFNNGHRCSVCDQPVFNEASLCDFCQKEKKNFVKLYAPFLYEKKIKNAVLAFKESNQRFRAKAFARMIVKYMSPIETKFDFITFVPMTQKKQKQRGFNQSQLLAEEIGKLINVPVLNIFNKVRDSEAQKFMNFKQRRENIMGMFTLKDVKLNKKQNVLLVDDIVTTCATVGYLSGLIYPKVNSIRVCCIAREYVREADLKKK